MSVLNGVRRLLKIANGDFEYQINSLGEQLAGIGHRVREIDQELAGRAVREAGAEGQMERPAPSELQPPAASRPLDSVLVITIPKSGTVYMKQALQQGLGLENLIISNQYFPDDQIDLDKLYEFKRGGYFCSGHISASEINLQLLDTYIHKWIVHFRDPRSVTLSWIHHVDRLISEQNPFVLNRVCPKPPEWLHGEPFEKKADWYIDNFMPGVIFWMQSWIDAAEKRRERVFVTEFSQLRSSEEQLISEIIRFSGIDAEKYYNHRPPEKTIKSHFRTGTLDEWRTVFTPTQQERASAMIPGSLLKKFNWPD